MIFILDRTNTNDKIMIIFDIVFWFHDFGINFTLSNKEIQYLVFGLYNGKSNDVKFYHLKINSSLLDNLSHLTGKKYSFIHSITTIWKNCHFSFSQHIKRSFWQIVKKQLTSFYQLMFLSIWILSANMIVSITNILRKSSICILHT